MGVFSRILMISVNDCVCEGFTQCNFNVAHVCRNTAVPPKKNHEIVHEGGNRGHITWQRAFQFDRRAALVMGYSHWKTTPRYNTRTCTHFVIELGQRTRDAACLSLADKASVLPGVEAEPTPMPRQLSTMSARNFL